MSQETLENSETLFQREKALIEQHLAVLTLPDGFNVTAEESRPSQQRTVITIAKNSRFYKKTSSPWVINHDQNPPATSRSAGQYRLLYETSPFISVNGKKRVVSVDGYIFLVFESVSSSRQRGFFVKKP